jgi:hypothetical protein
MNTTIDWKVKRVYLRSKFTTGIIANCSRKELEEYLVILANEPDVVIPNENESFALVISHLLKVRIWQELHRRTERISILALIISAVAVAVAVLAMFTK